MKWKQAVEAVAGASDSAEVERIEMEVMEVMMGKDARETWWIRAPDYSDGRPGGGIVG
jgi:hypothetical protein